MVLMKLAAYGRCKMESEAAQVPLIELLQAVPNNARLLVDDPNSPPGFPSTTSYPVGLYCHGAAAELVRLRAALAEAEKALRVCDEALEKTAADWRHAALAWQQEMPGTEKIYALYIIRADECDAARIAARAARAAGGGGDG